MYLNRVVCEYCGVTNAIRNEDRVYKCGACGAPLKVPSFISHSIETTGTKIIMGTGMSFDLSYVYPSAISSRRFLSSNED